VDLIVLSIMAFLLEAFEAVYAMVLIVVFILLAFVCQRKTWMWFGITIIFAFGVAYVAVPTHVLKFQVLNAV